MLRALAKKIYDGLQCSFKESEPCFLTYGFSVVVGVLGFYFINQRLPDNIIYEDLRLRVLAALFVIPIIFKKLWPPALKKYLLWYWYLVLVYTLPFFFSFMILMNPMSHIWHINGIICLVVLILFVDIASFILLIFIGVSAGFTYYYIKVNGEIFFPTDLKQALATYIGPLIYIFLFSRKKEKVQLEKLNTMKLVAESIAHELRTPLSAMTLGSQSLAKLLPQYSHAYALAKSAHLPVRSMSSYQESALDELPRVLERVSLNANAMISLMLANLREGSSQKVEFCSMHHCVKEALEAYPFSEEERPLIHWDRDAKNDFTFVGHVELTKHVLFNLIKNSLYAIALARNGEISIILKPWERNPDRPGKKFHRLIFKDTGIGISSRKLHRIFDRFYSNKDHGTGIGLAFCRSTIQEFGGDIVCDSTEGKYTTFEISLPVV